MKAKIPFTFRWYHFLFMTWLISGLAMPQVGFYQPAKSLKLLFSQYSWVPTKAVAITGGLKDGNHLCDGIGIFLTYEYTVQNKVYTSNQYSFQDCFPLGEEAKLDILNQYSPGQEIVVYVNPKNPHQAVVHKDPFWNVFISCNFVLIIIVAWLICRLVWLALSRNLKDRKFNYLDYFPENKSLKLTGRYPPSKKIKIALYTIIPFNIFLAPYVLFNPSLPAFYVIWGGEILIILYFIIELKLPHVHIELPRKDIHIADEININAVITGNVHNINSLEIYLKCEETVHVGDGLETREVSCLLLLACWSPDVQEKNPISLSIPADGLPSLLYGAIRITWLFEVKIRTKRNIFIQQKIDIGIGPNVKRNDGY